MCVFLSILDCIVEENHRYVSLELNAYKSRILYRLFMLKCRNYVLLCFHIIDLRFKLQFDIDICSHRCIIRTEQPVPMVWGRIRVRLLIFNRLIASICVKCVSMYVYSIYNFIEYFAVHNSMYIYVLHVYVLNLV